MDISDKFICFDPHTNELGAIPDTAGNYLICLRSGSKLPQYLNTPILTKHNDLMVIYTGIASKSIRKRDYRQHFRSNNAGMSTLRKSLGVLMKFKLIPRDKNPNSGKTKFCLEDELLLSEWMNNNLLLFYLPNSNFREYEILLINYFNPPLNLKDNKNEINTEFRQELSALRSKRNIQF